MPKLKFLVDENVRVELPEFLTAQGIDFQSVPKGIANKEVARLSKTQKRILVTNDTDFTNYPKSKIFSVVLLRLPQNNPQLLISSFSKVLLREKFAGKLLVLTISRIEEYRLEENQEVVV